MNLLSGITGKSVIFVFLGDVSDSRHDSGGAGSGADSGGGGESGSDDPAGSLTLPEYIYATYNELLKNGWRMNEIDEMDMLGFLRLRAWDATREQEKKSPGSASLMKSGRA